MINKTCRPCVFYASLICFTYPAKTLKQKTSLFCAKFKASSSLKISVFRLLAPKESFLYKKADTVKRNDSVRIGCPI